MFFEGPKNPPKNSLNFSVTIGTVFLKKTRVGFGRTELSLRLSCTEFCALSSGHGPRGLGFQGGRPGWSFMFFRGVKNPRKKCLNFLVKVGTVFLKKLGSDLVVQSSR